MNSSCKALPPGNLAPVCVSSKNFIIIFRNLQPVETWFVSFLTQGEGWHNYHHAFPWDYKAAEYTMHFNLSATLIRFFEKIGIAYDLKSASPEMVIDMLLENII